MSLDRLGIWFPAIKVGTGVDVFTEQLCAGLNRIGIRAEVSWLPPRAEYLPWTVQAPKAPSWATAVHVNTWLHPRFIPKHLPIVATLHHAIHDPDLRPYKNWQRAAYHRWWIAPIERRVLKRAQRVVAASQFAASMACRTLCDVPINVIHNGIDTGRFEPIDRARAPNQPFRLLYVGSWKTLKGVDLLAPIMRELGNEFELYYTGGAAAEVDKPLMPSNMKDIGRLEGRDVVDAMQRADAFLFPTRSEGFGLVAIEAMACGLPVIAANVASLPEVVKNSMTGLLCLKDDIGAFAVAARRLSHDVPFWAKLSAAASTEVQDRFSLDVMISKYLQIYRHIL